MGIVLKGITKDFDRVRALSSIDLEIEKGEFCVLLGPSGCGKSTLLRIIAGLEEPTEGRVFIDGVDVTSWSPKERDIAMVFQSYALYPHMDVFNNMAFALRLRGVKKDEIKRKVEEVARFLEIDGLLNRRPSQLSGGERQRVAIGRALVREPDIFLFDEPLSNLDAVLRAGMRVEIARLHRKLGVTMVYVTHDQIEAMTLGERIVVMDRGVIQQVGSPEDIYTRPANLFVARFVGSPPINTIKGRIRGMEEDVFFVADGISIGVDGALAKFSGREVVLGIRAEDVVFTGNREGDIRARVEIIEDTGAERLVYLNAGRHRIVAKTISSPVFREGDEVGIAFNKERLLFFYQDSVIDMD